MTTNVAASITDTSALLSGSVNPNGCQTTSKIEWGPSSNPTAYPNVVSGPSGAVSFNVSHTASGLQPNTGYHYRISATNGTGTTPGPDKPFTTAAPAKDPILFVHGWESSADTWYDMEGWFHDKGWPWSHLYTFSYDTNQSNVTTSGWVSYHVDKLLQQTGAKKVDIITHSMGGYSSRYYLKNLGGTSKVEDWVSLAGPNHGTSTILFCIYTACEEMKQNSSFLTALNAGDETPGSVRYATWKSACDFVVDPPQSVDLSGAVINEWTSCLLHTQIHKDHPTFEKVRGFVK